MLSQTSILAYPWLCLSSHPPCQVPKLVFWIRSALGHHWKEEELLKRPEEVSHEVRHNRTVRTLIQLYDIEVHPVRTDSF
jgi:hypothetical protein